MRFSFLSLVFFGILIGIPNSFALEKEFDELPSIEELKTMCNGNFLWESKDSVVLLDICEIDEEYGEYPSQGNIWIEVTHSAANPPVWSIWGGTYLKHTHPDEWKSISTELELAQKFFKQYDISIIDLVKSNKNADLCEAIGCLFGTYHLLLSETGWEKYQKTNFEPELKITITPDKVKYGESLLFEYSLTSYEKPDEERYTYFVLNPDGIEIDATLWFARNDSEYKFETNHQAYDIVKAGNYTLNFEETYGMERTGKIVETAFFEITTNPSPLTQYERGINLREIRCNNDLQLIFKSSYNSPACVKPESIPKLIDRGWARDAGTEISFAESLQECSRVPGKEITCKSEFVCYEHLSGGLGPLGSIPIESIGGDKLCHKQCETDDDCPTNTPNCLVTKRSTEDYVEAFRLCFEEQN